ncbi:hypothetical protein V866_007380 [Kwoniella sp. B9012]
MSRSHIDNMHSISSLPSVTNQELSTPRSIPSPAYGLNGGACTPPPRMSSDRDRERPRDSGVHAIGAFFSTPYDSDLDSDDESISTTTNSNTTRQPVAVARARSARAISVNVNKATAKAYKDALEAKIKSQAGELDNWEDNQDDHDGREELEPPRSPLKRSEERGRQSDESGRVRPLTVVEFPEPTLQPDQGHGRGYPNSNAPPSYSNSNSTSGYPRTPPRSNPNPTNAPLRPNPRIDTSGLSPPRTILLPPPSSPISPLLAAPPRPHFSPLSSPSSPFASPGAGGHGRADSVSNGSIRGFDIMAEKKALFREGQEELFTPFSTRRNKPGRMGVNGKQTKSAFLASGMDFWKRFSVHVRLDEQEKASKNENAWLSKAQERRGRIKKIIWVVVILLIIIVAALVAYFVTRPSPPPASIATSI